MLSASNIAPVWIPELELDLACWDSSNPKIFKHEGPKNYPTHEVLIGVRLDGPTFPTSLPLGKRV